MIIILLFSLGLARGAIIKSSLLFENPMVTLLGYSQYQHERAKLYGVLIQVTCFHLTPYNF